MNPTGLLLSTMPSLSSLIEKENTLALLIDCQPGFLSRLEFEVAQRVMQTITTAIRAFHLLNVPLLATVEMEAVHGSILPQVSNSIDTFPNSLEKHQFGFADQANLLGLFQAQTRSHIILLGFETDVCICQSALGLMDAGFYPRVVGDGVGSPGAGHKDGLRRMLQQGIIIQNLRSLLFELGRSPTAIRQLREQYLAQYDTSICDVLGF
jgi:nicotinamidase-related amidase